MRSKKGFSEADWAMSMGIFMLYLVWFFIVIKPTFSPETRSTLPLDELKKSFNREASWSINKTPMIIRSNITGSDEPVIVDFPFSGIEQQYSIPGKYIKLDDGRLFFLAELYRTGSDSTQLYYLLHSTSNYTQPDIYSDLSSSEESASTSDISVSFIDGLIDRVFFRNSIRIIDYWINVDGSAIDTSTNIQNYNKLFSKHEIITPQLNHTSYIMLNNSRIYNFFSSDAEKHVSVAARLDRYDHFYINPSTGGAIKYNQSACDSYTTDFIDLYGSAEGLSFIFDDDVDLELCHDKNLSVTAEFDVSGKFGYRIIFHDSGTDASKMVQPYKLIFGAEDVLQGISPEKLFYLKERNYSDVRSNWSYGYDFNITIMNSTNSPIFSLGIIPSTYVTTAGKTYNYNKLDQNGNMERVSLILITW